MSPEAALDGAVREGRARICAALAVRLRDIDLAEEAFAFACAAAVEAWRRDGAPRDGAAWLYAVARRRAFDLARRSRVRREAMHDEPPPEPTPEDTVIATFEPIPDERLRLIFVCCHPALNLETRAALTLKVVCGLSTERLAKAFLTSELTMTQRLTRAKRKIRGAHIPFETPQPAEWPERLGAVLATLEIAYAQAYESAAPEADAAELAAETLRLSALLAELAPKEPEILGLAALVRLAEARRPARLAADGALIPLDRQDPQRWDPTLIAQAASLMKRAARLERTGPYQLMAAIHAAHASRMETGQTPWTDIVFLYGALLDLRPSPIAAINRAVALCHAEGPEAGLAALAEAATAADLAGYAPYHLALAFALERAGRPSEAQKAMARGLALTPSDPERRHLTAELARLTAAA